MWSLWAATGVEPHAINILYHRLGNQRREEIESPMPPWTPSGPFGVLDKALARSGWLVGDRFTVADINAAEIVRPSAGRAGTVQPRRA